MRVVCNLNLAVLGQAGSEHDVDESDPFIQAMLAEGVVEPAEQFQRWFCTKCVPPSRWDSEVVRDIHVAGDVHDVAQVVEGRSATRTGRDRAPEHDRSPAAEAPPPDGR